MEYMEVSGKRYRLLHPRPVYVIVAGVSGGTVNAMAASWVSPFSEEPERIMLALEKDSYTRELIEKNGEFTVNVVEEEHMKLVWCVGTTSGRNVDKISECGVKLEDSRHVKAPHLSNALGYIEARVYRILTDAAEDVDLIIADVVAAYARSDIYNPRYGWVITKAPILMHVSGRAFVLPGRLVILR